MKFFVFETLKTDLFLLFLSVLLILSAALLSVVLRIKSILSPFTIRSLVHILGGSWVFIWLRMSEREIATGFCFLVTLIVAVLSIIKRKEYMDKAGFLKKAIDGLSSGDETLLGPVLYGFSLTAISYLCWEKRLAGACSIFVLSLGDGMADLIGRNFGRRFYRFPWGKRKSMEGSCSCLVFSTVALILGQWASSSYALSIADILVVAIMATIVEAVSPENSDNVLVPGVVILYFYLFL